MRSLGQWISSENSRPKVLGRVGARGVLRRLLGTCSSVLIFLGSQVLAFCRSPVRKGLLGAHNPQEHIFKALTSPARKNPGWLCFSCCLSIPNVIDREDFSKSSWARPMRQSVFFFFFNGVEPVLIPLPSDPVAMLQVSKEDST